MTPIKGILEKQWGLVGTHIPRSVHEHLGLAVLVDNTTRTALIRKYLTEYLATKPIPTLIHELARRALFGWLSNKKKMTYHQYRDTLIESLIKRKLSPVHISEIIKILNEDAK